MRLLLTGACGFVGAALAGAWRAADPAVTIIGFDSLVRPGSERNRRRLGTLGVEFVHGDVRNAGDIEALPSVDWVVDMAANPSVLAGVDGRVSSRQLIDHNLRGTLNLLEYCRRSNAGFILLSTSRVYSARALAALPVESTGEAFRLDASCRINGLSALGLTEAFSTEPPLSLYGASKRASELLALEYGEAFGFPVWIDRAGVLAGAGQHARPDQGIFSYWIHRWQARQPLAYLGFDGTGQQVRDCLHPLDLLPLLRAQTRDPGDRSESRVFNVSGGAASACSLRQCSAWCADRFGAHEVRAAADSVRPYDAPWIVLDSASTARRWRWQPTMRREAIFEEIAMFAEAHPDWLESSCE
jgi:CDP-paratose 2-epimerase